MSDTDGIVINPFLFGVIIATAGQFELKLKSVDFSEYLFLFAERQLCFSTLQGTKGAIMRH